MLAITCPRCQAKAPISLANTEHVTCEHCGERSDIPEEGRANMRLAIEEIGKLDDKERQLSTKQRGAYRRSAKHLVLVLGIGLTFALIGLFHWYLALDPERGVSPTKAHFIYLSLMSVAVLAATVLGILAVGRARKKIVEVAAAEPPLVEGGAVRCRVCGGELVEMKVGISTCAFCRCDNIVDPRVLTQAKKARHVVLDNYREEVAVAAKRIGRKSGFAGLGVALVIFSLPVLIVFTQLVVGVFIPAEPANLSIEYVAWPVGDRRCIGKLTRLPDGSARIDFHSPPPPGMSETKVKVPSLEGLVVIRANQLLAQRVIKEHDGTVGVVESIEYWPDVEENMIIFDGYNPQNITETCLAVSPDPSKPAVE